MQDKARKHIITEDLSVQYVPGEDCIFIVVEREDHDKQSIPLLIGRLPKIINALITIMKFTSKLEELYSAYDKEIAPQSHNSEKA